MFTLSQQEDCPLIPPRGLQTPSNGEPSTPLALTLHTPVPRQMLLPPTSVWCGALVIQQA